MNLKSKKIILLVLFVIALFIVLNPVVMAEDVNYSNLCASSDSGFAQASIIIGYVVAVAKWIVPLIIIVLGMIDFGKAAISDDEKALNKATSTLIKRIIAGVVVFFIPTIILALLDATGITGDMENSTRFGACTKCILKVSECDN